MKTISKFRGIIFVFLALLLIHSCKKTDGFTGRDGDGNVYNTVTIGNQTWMAENLKTTKYRNGDKIGTTTPASLNISGESTPKYQWAYNGDESNADTYGRLYTWFAVVDSRNVCPKGWHLPTFTELQTLTTYLGGESVAGGKLREKGTAYWAGGSRSNYYNDPFGYLGRTCAMWTTTEYDGTCCAWTFGMDDATIDTELYIEASNKKDAVSVRCIKN